MEYLPLKCLCTTDTVRWACRMNVTVIMDRIQETPAIQFHHLWEKQQLQKKMSLEIPCCEAPKHLFPIQTFSLEKFAANQQIAFTVPLRGCWAWWTLQITICSNTILCRVCGKAGLNNQKRLYIPQQYQITWSTGYVLLCPPSQM